MPGRNSPERRVFGTPTWIQGEPIARAIKLGADDLKFFCYQAAMARPGPVTGIALDNWFFGETLAGRLHLELRRLLLSMDDPDLRRVGGNELRSPHDAAPCNQTIALAGRQGIQQEE